MSETPEDGRAHFLLARVLEADARSNEAVAEYHQAVALFGLSTFAGAQVEKVLATVLEKSGRSAEALQTYKQRYDAFPNEDTKADYNAAKQRLAGPGMTIDQATVKSAPAPKSIQKAPVSAAATRADNQAAQAAALFEDKSKGMQAAIIQQRWNDAEELGNATVALAEKMVPQDERLVSALRNIGQVYLMQRKFPEAEKDYVRSVQVSEQLFGPKNPNSISALNDLGLLYTQERNFPQAIEYLNRAVTLAEAYDPRISEQSLDLLGEAQREQGDFKSAEQSYKKMLALEEARGGPASPPTVVGVERLGLLYM